MELIEFNGLRLGQAVKISGKYREDAGFLAVEIALAPPAGDAELESVVQSVDLKRNLLRLCNQSIALLNDIELKDMDGHQTGLPALKPGVMIKLKGKYAASTGFVPTRIKLRETLEFNIEQVQGVIEKINRPQRTFQVNGMTILVAANTVIFDDAENFDERRETRAPKVGWLG